MNNTYVNETIQIRSKGLNIKIHVYCLFLTRIESFDNELEF